MGNARNSFDAQRDAAQRGDLFGSGSRRADLSVKSSLLWRRQRANAHISFRDYRKLTGPIHSAFDNLQHALVVLIRIGAHEAKKNDSTCCRRSEEHTSELQSRALISY